MGGAKPANARLVDVELDESIGRSTPDVEHERAVAIFDLIEENSFRPVGDAEPYPEAPYAELVLHIHREAIHHLAEVCLLRDLYLWADPDSGRRLS